MNDRKQLLNAIWLTLVGVFPYVVNFIALPIFSTHISVEDFGRVGVATAFVAFVASYAGIQMSSALSRLYFDHDNKSLPEFISTILLANLLLSTTFVGFSTALSIISFDMLSGDSQFEIMAVASALTILSTTNTCFERVLLNESRGGVLLFRTMVSSVLSFIFSYYLVVEQELGGLGFLLGLLMGSGIVTTFYLVMLRRYLTLSYKLSYLKPALKYSFPLVFHALGGIILMYGGYFVIEKNIGLEAAGLFFIADRFSQIVKVIINSINNALMPLYNRQEKLEFGRGRRFLEQVFPVWFIIILVFIGSYCTLLVSFIEEFMPEEYSESYVYIVILSVAYIFRGFYCFSSASLFFYKKTARIPLITFVSGSFALLIYLLFSATFGLVAVVWGFFSGLVLQSFLARLFEIREGKSLRFQFPSLMFFSSLIFMLIFYDFIADSRFILVAPVLFMVNLLFLFVLYRFDISAIRTGLTSIRRMLNA